MRSTVYLEVSFFSKGSIAAEYLTFKDVLGRDGVLEALVNLQAVLSCETLIASLADVLFYRLLTYAL